MMTIKLNRICFDKCHSVRPLPSLPNKTPAWVTTANRVIPGRVVQQANTPRSYFIEAKSGKIRRNRSQFRIRSDTETIQPADQTPNQIATRCRTGTAIKPPNKLNL